MCPKIAMRRHGGRLQRRRNMVLNTYNLPPFAKGITIQEDAILEHARALIKESMCVHPAH